MEKQLKKALEQELEPIEKTDSSQKENSKKRRISKTLLFSMISFLLMVFGIAGVYASVFLYKDNPVQAQSKIEDISEVDQIEEEDIPEENQEETKKEEEESSSLVEQTVEMVKTGTSVKIPVKTVENPPIVENGPMIYYEYVWYEDENIRFKYPKYSDVDIIDDSYPFEYHNEIGAPGIYDIGIVTPDNYFLSFGQPYYYNDFVYSYTKDNPYKLYFGPRNTWESNEVYSLTALPRSYTVDEYNLTIMEFRGKDTYGREFMWIIPGYSYNYKWESGFSGGEFYEYPFEFMTNTLESNRLSNSFQMRIGYDYNDSEALEKSYEIIKEFLNSVEAK